jgi:hypothetical protein
MAIVRAGDRPEQMVPCVVTMDRAWIWSEEVGDPRQAAQMTHAFVQALRMADNIKNVIALHLLIQDHLGDLLSIPPRPTLVGEAIAEVTVTERQSGKSHEVELTADV